LNVWFIRSNGETLHNNPGTKLFVPGEPPRFPNRKFNYRLECLEGGFARVGWPAAGDLRIPGWRTRGRDAYGMEFTSRYIGYLEGFLAIRAGDIVLIPADRSKYDVHVGVVGTSIDEGRFSCPYFYRYEATRGDVFENAHRMPVSWARKSSGEWTSVNVSGLGGLWLQGFARLESTRSDVARQAAELGLLKGLA